MRIGFREIDINACRTGRYAVRKTGKSQILQKEIQGFEEILSETKQHIPPSFAGSIYNNMSFKWSSVLKAYEIHEPEAEREREEDLEPEAVKNAAKEKEETQTETDIIVKQDGSRVLVITMNVGGTETTMSLKISEPTDMPNGSALKANDMEGEHNNMETMWRENIDTGTMEG